MTDPIPNLYLSVGVRRKLVRSSMAGKYGTILSTNTSLLVSHIQGLQNLKPILKNIYILISSYLSDEVNQGNCWSSSTENGLKFILEETTTLSTLLLDELHRKLSLTSHEASLDQYVGLTLSDNDIKDSQEILLLLRCCCLMVWLHPHDHTVIQKLQGAVALLSRLYLQLISSQNIKSTDLSVCLVKQILEVYVDEMFAGRPFQECLVISESISSTWQNHSMRSSIHTESVLDVIASHFLLSVCGNCALQTFLESLIWTEKRVQSHPELCLTVGLSLIKHPVVMSTPIIIHSHLISLVSEVIGTHFFPNKAGHNISRSKSYLSVFYDGAILYNTHFSKLMTSPCSQRFTPENTAHKAFESLFQFEVFGKVKLVTVEMDRIWRAQIGETTSSLFADAISYIKLNIHMICEAYRDNVITFMTSVISKVVSAEIDELLLERIRVMTLQDICLLASILKLMSSSLMRAASDSKNELSCLELFSESKHMSFFAQYNLLPMNVQQLISESLKPGLSTYDEYKLMFVHFAGLLSLCIISGLDILVKGCLTFMLVLMSILTQKEGGSDSLRPLGSASPVHEVSEATCSIIAEESTPNSTLGITQMKISSTRAASKFQRARHSLLRRHTSLDCSDISDEETCNGEAYLRCFTNDFNDIAELADFIECKKEKDYPSWLVKRGEFRSKRLKKFAQKRRQRMTKVCRSLGSNGRVKL